MAAAARAKVQESVVMSGNGDQTPKQATDVTSGAAGGATTTEQHPLVTLGDMQTSSSIFAKKDAKAPTGTVALNTVTIDSGSAGNQTPPPETSVSTKEKAK